MRHRSTKALYAYWDALRGQELAPARTQIDPRGIADVLGDVFLLEGTAADFRFRLAGSRIVHALNRPLTGQRFEEIWLPAARPALQATLLTVSEDFEPVLLGFRKSGLQNLRPNKTPRAAASPSWENFRDANGLPHLNRRVAAEGSGELLLLPLRHPGRNNGRILGALALFEVPLSIPADPLVLEIVSSRVLGRAALPRTGSGLRHGALSEESVERRGHLLVINGKKGREPAGKHAPRDLG